MTDLSKLTVSLTKHGAHKVTRLLKNFPVEKVLANTWGTFEDIRIDGAQAKKNLSAFADGSLPGVWAEAKRIGGATLDRLVFVAIAFSHHELITSLKKGAKGFARGSLTDVSFQGRKSFTNFKNDIEELGFAIEADNQHVSYDLSAIFQDKKLPPLVAKVFGLKLKAAGWTGDPNLIDECIALGFHEALAVPEEYFRDWLSGVISSEKLEPRTGQFSSEFSDEFDKAEPSPTTGRGTPARLRLGVPGDMAVILSDPNGISAIKVTDPLQTSQEQLQNLSEALDGFIGQDASSEEKTQTNRSEIPLAEEDLQVLRSLVKAAIEIETAPVITQGSTDFLDYVLALLEQAKALLDAVNDTTGKYLPLITAITALGALIVAIAAL